MVCGLAGVTSRSKKWTESASCEPPKPWLTALRLGKDWLIFQRRMVELPMKTKSAVAGERLVRACSSFRTSGSQRSGDFFSGVDFSSRCVVLAAVSGLGYCSRVVSRSERVVRAVSRCSLRCRGVLCIWLTLAVVVCREIVEWCRFGCGHVRGEMLKSGGVENPVM